MHHVNLIPIEKAFAKTQINCVIYRRNSLSSFNGNQIVSYYDAKKRVCFAHRKLEEKSWVITRMKHRGNVVDAHNCISIIHDSAGFLHASYDHHNHPLQYNKTKTPLTCDFTEKLPMTGVNEQKVCYPQFYRDSKGFLYFFFRDGRSGNGNLNLKRYNPTTHLWEDIQTNLIDGENERNAYWQIWLDETDTIHLSWIWRETGEASSNHDLCYAKSMDGGYSWVKSNGESQSLPITQTNADYVLKIPQNSALINQTSMATDSKGNPYIASIWRPEDEKNPQYMIVYFHEGTWRTTKVGHNPSNFDFKGRGTLRFPISRPLLLIDKQDSVYVVFRATSRNEVASIVTSSNLLNPDWVISDLTDFPLFTWEPTMDFTLWKNENVLHLLIQKTGHNKTKEMKNLKPQMLYLLECNPRDFLH